MLRNVGAAVAGFVVWSVLWLVAGQVAHAMAPDAFAEDGSTRHTGVLLAFLGASVVCSLAAGRTVKVVARRSRLLTGLALGVILLAVGVAVQVQVWDAIPLWYHLSFLALLVPMTAAGAASRARKSTGSATLDG